MACGPDCRPSPGSVDVASPKIRSETHPFTDQWIGFVIGGLLTFVIIAGSISPRTFAFTPWLAGIAVIGFGLWRRNKPSADRAFLIVAGAVIAFPAFALASSVWATYQEEAVGKSASALAISAMTLISIAFLAIETRANRLRVAEGVWLGALVSALYLAFEVWSGQAFRIGAINLLGLQPKDFATPKWFTWQNGRVVAADFGDLTRIVALLPLALGPALLAAWEALAAPWRNIASVLLIASTALAVYAAGSELAKIALTIFLVTGVLAFASTVWTLRLLVVGWLAACLLMIPLVIGLHQLAPHRNAAIGDALRDSSPEQRLTMWRDYATWSLERPLLGHGANHTYVWNRQINEAVPSAGGPPWKKRSDQTWPHTHNMYLQAWYDLGAVGALLLSALGVAVLWRIGQMERRQQIANLATFAAVAAFIPTSYGLWQPWLLGLFAVVGISAAAASLPSGGRQQDVSEPVAHSAERPSVVIPANGIAHSS